MKNLRIVSNNAIDSAVLTASSEASASMGVANLKMDKKSSVWRSANGTIARLNASWSSAVAIACVALPFCNLSPTATMRVRVTNEQPTTNLFLFSDQFENAAWARGSTTTINTAGLTAGPDGTMNARTFWGTATGTNTLSQAVTLTKGQPYTFSTFYKIGTFTGSVTFTDSTEAGSLIYNLQTATATVSGIFTSAVVTSYGNGWYRVSCTVTPTLATTAHTFTLSSPGGTNYSYVWGMMLNAGSLSSYYPSFGTPGARPFAYIDSWQSYAYDTGAVLCCPEPAAQPRGWTGAQAASAYAYGGGAFARVWLPTQQVLGLAVDIVDTNNLQGYIEAARLVAGSYWSTTYNPSAVSFGIVDTTTLSRSEAGDQLVDPGTIYKKLSLTLTMMPAQDRMQFISMLRSSKVYPILVSVFPEIAEEGDTIIYGRRSKDSELAMSFNFVYNSNIEVESI